MPFKPGQSEQERRCSFCHKSQDVVGKLISSPTDYPRAYICNECIMVCNSILQDMPSVTPAHQITLDPDLARAFPNSEIVNNALRQLLAIAQRLLLQSDEEPPNPP